MVYELGRTGRIEPQRDIAVRDRRQHVDPAISTVLWVPKFPSGQVRRRAGRRSRAGSGSLICGRTCIVNGCGDPAHGVAVLFVAGLVSGRDAHEMRPPIPRKSRSVRPHGIVGTHETPVRKPMDQTHPSLLWS